MKHYYLYSVSSPALPLSPSHNVLCIVAVNLLETCRVWLPWLQHLFDSQLLQHKIMFPAPPIGSLLPLKAAMPSVVSKLLQRVNTRPAVLINLLKK